VLIRYEVFVEPGERNAPLANYSNNAPADAGKE